MTGDKRLTSLPDVPTLKEQGIDVVVNGWHGLFAPAKTPDCHPRQDRQGHQAGDEGPQVGGGAGQGRRLELPPDRTRAEFAKFVADEHAFWGKKLKALKIDME